MPFKLKEGADTEGLPTIVLAGRSYFVARVPLRYRIKIDLLRPKLNAFLAAMPKKEEIKTGATFEFSEEHYLVMIDIASWGLLALYPDATREKLLDEDIDFEEIFTAWPVVLNQAASRRPASGEAVAASSSTNSTGEGSSPISA